MPKSDAVLLASRTLAVLLTVWVLADVSHLPGAVYTFLHYASVELSSPSATQYYRHSNLIYLGFLIARIIGISLLARWLYNGSPDVAELLLPAEPQASGIAFIGKDDETNHIR